MNAVMKTILERRSIRAFDREKTISESELTEIVKAAHTPPAQ